MRLTFDFPDPTTGQPLRTILADPDEVVRAGSLDAILPALRRVEDAVARGLTAAGYIAYEAAPAFEPRMRVRSPGRMPLLTFGLFPTPPNTSTSTTTSTGTSTTPPALDWRADLDRTTHREAVERIRAHIAAGRTYQVNLTTRLRACFTDDPLALYDRMRRAQGPGYHAFLDLGRFAIASASPELFFETRGLEITTRPMKGTRPRGRWTAEDLALRNALAASPKDRAENLMIVDMLRSDLGRVARTGSVRVPRLLDIERYRTVWQMTSTVAATLRDGVALTDTLAALFPCGSVTGAPKISTMEVIAELEPSPREVYCGAIGLIRPGGDATFSVPIRTAWVDHERGEAAYGAGGGVVWDSTAEGEYDELLAKAVVVRGAWPEFRLVETLRLDDGTLIRLDRHLRRLRESAEHFDLPFPEDSVRAALESIRRAHRGGTWRVRLMLAGDSRLEVGATAIEGGASPEEVRPVALARGRVDSRDRFLYHKTTHRVAHDHARAGAPAGAWDVLLVNERGQLTEFSRGNLVVERHGALLTPPLDAGLLPGCLRAELLEAGTIAEETLEPADLDRASRLWFINSLRGWVEVSRSYPPPADPGTPGGGRCSAG